MQADSEKYVLWLAAEGHKQGLAVGLKNAGDLAQLATSASIRQP